MPKKPVLQTIKLVNEDIKIETQPEPPTFIQMCDNLIDKLTDEYKKNKEEIQKLKKQYQTDMKTAKIKKSTKPIKKPTSGITMVQRVPVKLCNLLNLDTDTNLSRIELTKKLYVLLEDRNLYSPDDKRVFRADDDFKLAFGLPDSVNESTDPKDKTGFNFYTLQSHIKQCYLAEKNNA